jgi:AraC-like DNA-binding protein
MKRAKKAGQHGYVGTRTYFAWRAMKQRCHNPKSAQYSWYGGRGIKVCDRWRYDFLTFLADMGIAPSKRHTLDRYPNVNGDYEPGNCRWATMKQQQECKRPRNSERLLTHDGKTLSVTNWAKEVGLSRSTIFARLYAGYSASDALTKKPQMGVSPGGWRKP